MSQKLYAVYDMVAENVVGMAVMLFPSDGAASRMFIDAVRSPKSDMHAHPGDYCLLCLGSLESTVTGDLEIVPAKFANRSPVVLGKDVGAAPVDDGQLSLLEK